MRYLHENTDKPHRCPDCHAVMTYWYRGIRAWLIAQPPAANSEAFRHWFYRRPNLIQRAWCHVDRLIPRRCQRCGDVVAVPAWISKLIGLKEE